MATSVLGYLTPGSPDKFIWTDSRSVSGTTKEAQYVLQGESSWQTFSAVAKGVITTTANAHIIFIQADGTNYTRLKLIRIWQSTLSGAVNTVDLSLFLTSTAGTGGTTITARGYDSTDTYSGTVMTLPTVKGTETNLMGALQIGVTATNPMTNVNYVEWRVDDTLKPIILGTAATSGIALKQINAVATCKLDVELIFTVTPWL